MEEEKKIAEAAALETTAAARNSSSLNVAQMNSNPDSSLNDDAIATGSARFPDKFRTERASRISERQLPQEAAVHETASAQTPTYSSDPPSNSSNTTRSRGKFRDSNSTSSGGHPGAFAVAGMTSSSQNNAIEADSVEDESDVAISGRHESTVETAVVAHSSRLFSSHTSSNHGAEQRSAPMVEAELVAPPVEALKVVFDEDHPDGDVEAHREQASDSARNSSTLDKKFFSHPRIRLVLWGAAILAALLAVVIPVAVLFKQDQEDERAEGGTSNSNADVTMSPWPTFPYECFWSNYELIGAQIDNPDQTQFVMCPGSYMKIGTMEDPANGNTNITNGDLMMMVLRGNVEIRCGDDGNVDNNCVLDGGFLQVLMQSSGNDENGIPEAMSMPMDNATIRGMTFTGEIFIDPYVGGASVVASHPGENIQLVDCRWENMTVAEGLVYTGVNPYQLSAANAENKLPGANEIDLKLVNCTFRNITYGGGCFIEAFNQRITVERCHFSDIRLTPFLSRCEGAFEANAEQADGWCYSLVSCDGSASCAIRDICVDGFEYAARSALVAANYGAEVVLEGNNSFNDLKLLYVEESDTCPNGLAWKRDAQQSSSCMALNDTDSGWDLANSECHL